MVKQLLIINGIIFLLQGALPILGELGAVNNAEVFAGMFWQPFTYMWLHADFFHILINMYVLWMFGGQMEMMWGSKRFLRFYLVCGVGAGFVILGWNLISNTWYVGPEQFSPLHTSTLGASGAIFGLLTAFSLTWPDRTILLIIPPMPVKAIWFIPLLLGIEFLIGGTRVSHAGHVGGVLIACAVMHNELRAYLGGGGGGFGLGALRYRWHRYRMRGRLRSVRREEWDRKRGENDDDDDRPTFH